jgi:hypothetical protein
MLLHSGQIITTTDAKDRLRDAVNVGSKAPGLLESLKERFCDFEISRLETLGKAVVDRLKKLYRISGAALILQQPGEARGSTQFPG